MPSNPAADHVPARNASLHRPGAGITGPYWERTSQVGPGFRYWNLWLPDAGAVGVLHTERAARAVLAAYRDPAATLESVRQAWERAAESM